MNKLVDINDPESILTKFLLVTEKGKRYQTIELHQLRKKIGYRPIWCNI